MVGGLRFDFHGPHSPSALFRGFGEHAFKQGQSHVMGAGARDQKSAALYELHSENIDVLIAAESVFDLVGALAERGGIEDDEGKFFSRRPVFPKELKHVRAFCFEVGNAVEPSVFFDVFEREGRNIRGDDAVRGQSRIQGKAAAV